MKHQSKLFILACIVFALFASVLQQCSSRANDAFDSGQTITSNDNSENLLNY